MSDPKPFPPVFATNRPVEGETVADELNFMLSTYRTSMREVPEIWIASAYVNPMGFQLIGDELEQAKSVRLLLGAEPEEPARTRTELARTVNFDQVLAHHLAGIRSERDLLGFDVETDRAARRFVDWLRSNDGARVEVRRFTKGFLHGKAFIVNDANMPGLLAGSSNMTRAGLSWNRELNLGLQASEHVGLVLRWYDELWNEAEPFDLAALYERRWEPHNPGIVFLRMLNELYGSALAEELDDPIGLPVTEFQSDGIRRALRLINQLGGTLVCDEVGLGKTFIAGEIIRRVSQIERQRVLLLVPAALKDSTWKPFLDQFELTSARVKIVTYDEFRIGTLPELQDLDDYSLIVVDEAHNLRNAAAERSKAVMDMLIGQHPKKVLLLTATPVNNSLLDLDTLVRYFVRNDAQFSGLGIPSIRDYILAAQAKDPDTLSPEHLFTLMDQVAVRRTRRFIKKEYPHSEIYNNRGELVPVEFPTPRLSRADYELDDLADDIIGQVLHALEVGTDDHLVIRRGKNRDSSRLSMARYAPSFYRKDDQVDRREMSNVGLLRSGLLKRAESSTAALESTVRRMVVAHHTFLDGLNAGHVMIGAALGERIKSDAADWDDFFDGLDDDALDQVSPASEFRVEELTADVESDLELLEHLAELCAQRRATGPDDKVIKLAELLNGIAEAAQHPSKHGISESDRRKVVVFSAYTDSIETMHASLQAMIDDAPDDTPLAAYRGRLAPYIVGAQGGGAVKDRSEVLAQFCPETAGSRNAKGEPIQQDRFDILLTTDVLSEGVNLQQAGQMINFDLPWNPMKLVQRHGRIDRIGSSHKHVDIACFFPADNLKTYLDIESVLQRKIAYANAAIGAGHVIPGQIADPTIEANLADERNQIERIYAGDVQVLINGGGNGALSGEEYRRRLERALASTNRRNDIEELPYGSGSGFISEKVRQSGYVFCARIGDHPEPWFRFVAVDANWAPSMIVDPDTGEQHAAVNGDLLNCLVAADPGPVDDAVRHLTDEATTQVFDAWAAARDDIFREWTHLTDIGNLMPELEKPLRQAVQLVADHFEHLGKARYEDLLQRLNGRWDRQVVGDIRAIVRDPNTTDKDKVTNLENYVQERGLPIPAAPQPLDPIDKDDIVVVCWQAVQAAASSSA